MHLHKITAPVVALQPTIEVINWAILLFFPVFSSSIASLISLINSCTASRSLLKISLSFFIYSAASSTSSGIKLTFFMVYEWIINIF